MNKQEIQDTIDELHRMKKRLIGAQGCSVNHEEANAYSARCLRVTISALTQQLNNGWIPVTERMPKEKENPITMDYYSYERTFTSDITTEVRYYSFGGGHWWRGHACVDGYVTAWRERPEPYKGVSDEQ